eukprot:GFUD01008048.1.p1 GENE.GFUD01008048.1~~GFUD01008048.1.p1  ORF type:complete len:467 (-),score=127.97 GFUD01008048.1:70-1470(-)
MKLLAAVCVTLVVVSQGYQPLRPQIKRTFPKANVEDVGEPLFLTPYIESGDVETGRQMARVDSTIFEGLDEDVESYSGFLTVDKPNNSNMFFWFFPAEEDPENAPVVIWLQGGPGLSSMFGALKLHGPIITTVDENNNLNGVAKNPYSWGKKHNMLYIDNPVGAGFSFSDALPTTQDAVTDNLYELLQQWYTLFPQYQTNPFYPFGDSYAGKFVPSITRRIHEQNASGNDVIKINLAGMGIGNGWMSPYHNARYGNFLYQTGMVDEKQRDKCLSMEAETQRLINQGQFYEAWLSWKTELSFFRNITNCSYIYNIALCEVDPAESKYEDLFNWESSRQALHVGNRDFFPKSEDVYDSMINVIMDDAREDIEICLENYKTLIYDGNFDIICNHSGVLDMVNDLDWSGADAYSKAQREVYYYNSKEVVGYLTKAENLNLLVVRNAGHMVPLSQPRYAQQMLEEFTAGTM